MTKFTAFVLLVTLRVFYHPADAQKEISPFASPASYKTIPIASVPAKFIQITGNISNHKVMLNWMVAANETADRFEVEKSADGKTFTMAALVFGTDKPDSDHYLFYEKAGKGKMHYRIRLINKNQQAVYSDMIEIKAGI